ncbi:DUF3306 domain-containing protein [Bradyrhizobium yuanmingense]|uniref:DUF3306 domain-containing protein n=1 Tax=Bradyrhizobium yuanmingense TaxID=108015 RepID=UPI0023BA3997|nr:DUF3306 domain-containing protein [Bradyrhizobium yuanmingense]MDF0580453.1 DUF3306 domain-containing protein [Bradyrhizobium yuanmingense]
MSEEDFLARWSRRKQQSRAEPAKPAPAQPEPPPETKEDETELDLSSLPSIDEINAATDITAFLGKGIPRELSRAALRRAWATDPAIRDFVGLAENAWDFNDPTAMPGFGPLDCSSEELAALVDRIVGGVREAAQSAAQSLAEASIEPADSPAESHQADVALVSNVAEPPDETRHLAIPAAVQPTVGDRPAESAEPVRSRTHGGALPR